MEDREYKTMSAVEKTHWWFVSRRAFVRRVLDSYLPGFSKTRRIADVGAGCGGMVPLLSVYGTVTGVEPSGEGRRLAAINGIRLVRAKAEKTGLRAGSFDAVCFFDVLYHRGVDDRRALAEAFRLLKPGGTLVVTDCAVPWLMGPHDRAVYGRERYTLYGITNTIRAADFTVYRQTYTFFFLFPFFAAKRLFDRWFRSHVSASDVTPDGGPLSELLVTVNRVESVLLRFVSFPWGSSLLVVARKERR